VFENKVIRKIFTDREDEVTKNCRNLVTRSCNTYNRKGEIGRAYNSHEGKRDM
jgi:hypothetical protein